LYSELNLWVKRNVLSDNLSMVIPDNLSMVIPIWLSMKTQQDIHILPKHLDTVMFVCGCSCCYFYVSVVLILLSRLCFELHHQSGILSLIIKKTLLISLIGTLLNYFAFYSFDFERTWWKLFQKRVVRSKFNIYVFIICNA
jgi:hypothetical protein